jgi:hypothetical protein
VPHAGFTLHGMPLFLEGRSGAVAGRRLTVTREKPFVFKTRTTNHQGEVQVRFLAGCYRLDNRSHLRCRIRGADQQQAVLVDGDDLEIGHDRFLVVIQPDAPSSDAGDEHDHHDTQSLAPISVDLPPTPAECEPTLVCAICDAPIATTPASGGWSDGERHLCARCLAKGVKPEQLARPFDRAVPQAITPLGTPVISDPEAPPAVDDPRITSATGVVAVRDPASDSTVEQLATVEPSATSDSDRQRQSRRISASRLTAVEPAQREGLLSKVGKVFGRRDERHQRVADLEAGRAALLAEAGRHALGAGGSLGLPEKAIATLLAGGTVTVSTADLSPADLERWRAQRQRMVMLDAEIAALRRALGLGSDPQMHQQSSPTLRPDQKAMQDRAFATLDGLSTDELSRADTQVAPTTVGAPDKAAASPSGRLRPAPPRRRR